MQGYDNRRYMWFGTVERSMWVPVPLSGASASPTGWSEGGTLLNGGGFEFNSWGSHRLYTFEWPESSSYQMAQKIASYADGTYGRGLIHFHLPTTYDKNVLPAYLADPSIAVRQEGLSLVSGVDPTAVLTSGGVENMLPAYSAHYDLTNTPKGTRGQVDSIYIPIPQGYYLRLGAMYQYSGPGRVFYQPTIAGSPTGHFILPAKGNDDEQIHDTTVGNGSDGVLIYVGKSSNGAASVTLAALSARLFKVGENPDDAGPWVGGMGNGGCRFVGKPTLSLISGHDGGRAGFAATLREVGPWMNG